MWVVMTNGMGELMENAATSKVPLLYLFGWFKPGKERAGGCRPNTKVVGWTRLHTN